MDTLRLRKKRTLTREWARHAASKNRKHHDIPRNTHGLYDGAWLLVHSLTSIEVLECANIPAWLYTLGMSIVIRQSWPKRQKSITIDCYAQDLHKLHAHR